MSDRVAMQLLKDDPRIKRVCICLDNDEEGRKSSKRIKGNLESKGVQVDILVPKLKVEYADKKEIIDGIVKKYRPDLLEEEEDTAGRCLPGGISQTESRMHESYRRSEKAVPIRTAPPGRRGNE